MPEIMCTLTVKQITECQRLIMDMYKAGMRSVRINTAHLTGVEQLDDLASTLKSMMPEIKILIDTKGPEMRTTAIAEGDAILLQEGVLLTVCGDKYDTPTSPGTIYVNYPDIHTEVLPGNVLLIDDGRLSLSVVAVEGKKIRAQVTTGGGLGSRKGMAVAGVDLNLPSVSNQDRMYIAYAAKSDYVDTIAHSFVRSAADVQAVKQAMGAGAKPIIAKIENQQGIDHLESIIAEADGILIARGDLTASIGKAAIPQAQEHIASATKAHGLPLYLATNILPSMMESDTPSPVDVAGIEKASKQHVDVMLLTNETASGRYPLQTVKTLYNHLLLI